MLLAQDQVPQAAAWASRRTNQGPTPGSQFGEVRAKVLQAGWITNRQIESRPYRDDP